MCNFLSALYLRTGKLICEPAYTDSHSELMLAFGVNERETTAPVQQFVRLELTPPSQPEIFDGNLLLDFDKWRENVDEREVPEWFDKAARFDAFDQMRDVLRGAANRNGDLLFGGLAFFSGKRYVTTMGVRVTAWSGSNVTAKSGSKVIAESGSKVIARSGSKVIAWSGSKVIAWSGSNVTAESGSNVTAKSGSKVTAESGSKVIAESGSNVTAKSGSKVIAESGSKVIAWSGSNVTTLAY